MCILRKFYFYPNKISSGRKWTFQGWSESPLGPFNECSKWTENHLRKRRSRKERWRETIAHVISSLLRMGEWTGERTNEIGFILPSTWRRRTTAQGCALKRQRSCWGDIFKVALYILILTEAKSFRLHSNKMEFTLLIPWKMDWQNIFKQHEFLGLCLALYFLVATGKSTTKTEAERERNSWRWWRPWTRAVSVSSSSVAASALQCRLRQREKITNVLVVGEFILHLRACLWDREYVGRWGGEREWLARPSASASVVGYLALNPFQWNKLRNVWVQFVLWILSLLQNDLHYAPM